MLKYEAKCQAVSAGIHQSISTLFSKQWSEFHNPRAAGLLNNVGLLISLACTMMHEAIVTQLHSQDQCFFPGSAVTLQHTRPETLEDLSTKLSDRLNQGREKTAQR